jgi:hypothetical protein
MTDNMKQANWIILIDSQTVIRASNCDTLGDTPHALPGFEIDAGVIDSVLDAVGFCSNLCRKVGVITADRTLVEYEEPNKIASIHASIIGPQVLDIVVTIQLDDEKFPQHITYCGKFAVGWSE